MDLKIPNIVKPIALKDYAEEFGDAVIWTWVNPTRALRVALAESILPGKATEEQIGTWFSDMWSQGPEDTRFTPEGVKELAHECIERDPQLWIWLIDKTLGLMAEHFGAKKKPLTTLPSN